MVKRMIIVMFGILVSGCGLTENLPTPDPNQPDVFATIAAQADLPLPENSVVVTISTALVYVAPNPRGRWEAVFIRMQLRAVPTLWIDFRVTEKANPALSLAELLPTLTAEALTVQERDGVSYAEGVNAIGLPVIYRDLRDYILETRLINTIANDLSNQAFADWREISLEGNLVEMR